VDYVNAHGTSTPINDPIETKAIKAAFGDHARKLRVSSTKSMHGHLLGGAGGIEAVVTVMAIRDQFFPPTRNLENPDPACDLDYVPNTGAPGRIRAAISNAFGFGGHNAVVLFREFNG
jgi:3-oxoacyl-[acyl-carrier-protein] synthase II